MKSVLLASVLALGSVAPVLLVETQAAYAQTLEQISGIQIQPSDQGIQIGIQTTSGSAPRFLPPSPNYRNVLVIDLLDAQLSEGGDQSPLTRTLSQSNPAPRILSVSVDRRTENSVRLTIIGSEQLPNVNVQAGDPGVVVNLGGQDPVVVQPVPTPVAIEPSPEPVAEDPTPSPEVPDLELAEITVRADRPNTYNPTSGTSATKTDTPLRDIPQSVQIVPQQILQDQGATRLEDALRNVPGAADTAPGKFFNANFALRGFEVNEFGDFGSILRNGLQDPLGTVFSDASIIEQVEVLKGPSSVLFGSGAPGGSVNIITKQPLSEPSYEISVTGGNFDTYHGSIDLTGPVNEAQTVLYRLIASYRHDGSSFRFVENESITIAPSLTWIISDQTSLRLAAEYNNSSNMLYSGSPAVGAVLPSPFGKVPRDLNVADSSSNIYGSGTRLRADLDHQFSQDWSLQSSFGYRAYRDNRDGAIFATRLLEDGRTLEREYQVSFDDFDVYSFATEITGKFETGSVSHQVLFGVSFGKYDILRIHRDVGQAAYLDIFNPVYGQPPLTALGDLFSLRISGESDSLGFYIQDQIEVSDNFKMLIGGRFAQVLHDSLTEKKRGQIC